MEEITLFRKEVKNNHKRTETYLKDISSSTEIMLETYKNDRKDFSDMTLEVKQTVIDLLGEMKKLGLEITEIRNGQIAQSREVSSAVEETIGTKMGDIAKKVKQLYSSKSTVLHGVLEKPSLMTKIANKLRRKK